MPSADPVVERLRRVAYERLQKVGIGRSPSFEGELNKLLERAAAQIHAEGADTDEGKVRAAEASTIVFTDAVVEAAREMNFSDAHEPTVFAALSKLCPLWPFC